MPLRCAFLSMDSLDEFVCDDDHALLPFRAAQIHVRTVGWRRPDVDWNDFDLVIVRSAWDYHLDLDAFFTALGAIEASRARLANPLPVMRWNADKRYLAELPKRGVACVPSRFGDGLNQGRLDDLHRHYAQQSWVIKPQVGANAGDTFVMNAQRANDARVVSCFADRGWIAQPFVDAVCDDGEYSLIYFNGHFSHAIRKRPAANDFRVQEEHGGLIESHEPTADLRAAAARALAALPEPCLYARVDLVLQPDAGWQLMELELIEPSLYLRMDDKAAARMAAAVQPWLQARGDA